MSGSGGGGRAGPRPVPAGTQGTRLPGLRSPPTPTPTPRIRFIFQRVRRTAGSRPPACAPTQARRRLLPTPSPDSPEQGRASRPGTQAREPHSSAPPNRRLMAPAGAPPTPERARGILTLWRGREGGGAEEGGGERKGGRRGGVGKTGGAEGERKDRVDGLEQRWPPPHLSPPLPLLGPHPRLFSTVFHSEGPREKYVNFC